MIGKVFALLGFGSLTAFCGQPEPPPLVDMLVDRFDVPACSDAQAVSAGGKNGPQGREVVRLYDADMACVRNLERAALEMDFRPDGYDAFVAEREQGWSESITVDVTDDQERGRIQWKEINP